MMGDCLLVAGRADEAVVWLDNARKQRELNGLLPQFLIEIYPLLALARLEQLQSQTDLSEDKRRAKLDEIAALAGKAIRLSKRRRHYRSPALRAAASCCWRQGRRRQAERLFARSTATAEQLGAPLQLAETHQTWGDCLVDAGDRNEGRAHLERAHDLFGRAGAVPLAARVGSRLERLQ
jgi:tetratricopeptide (TPR) repeat protein